jgi:hypothetical protein
MLRHVRGRAPSLPTAISLLALAIVLTGTAFAATGQIVNIADPSNSAHVAKVDGNGALRTTFTPSVPFAGSISMTANAMTVVTPPTTATLAFTRFLASNLADSVLHNAFQISIYQVGGSGGTCSGSPKWLASYDVPPSSTVVDALATPMVLKPPSGSPQWCLEAIAILSDNPGSYYLPHFAWNGYVVSGTFSGAPSAAQQPPASGEAAAKHVG